jgi:hypothetical protein
LHVRFGGLFDAGIIRSDHYLGARNYRALRVDDTATHGSSGFLGRRYLRGQHQSQYGRRRDRQRRALHWTSFQQ